MSLQQHNPDSSFQASLALSDGDWAKMLQDNQEAQDLLSNAIAHHHQHYQQDDDQTRRSGSHLHHKSDHYSTDPKTTNSGSYDDGMQDSEGDNSSDDTGTQADGKPAPKKAGRKPLTTEPTNKRKAQNRAAQRAFRERKERYVKSLEDRIKELEESQPNNMDSSLAEENVNLKVLVQKLETENYFLKEQSFTFDFPISQPSVYNTAKAAAQPPKSQGQEQSLLPSTAQQLHGNGKISYTSSNAKPVGSDRLPWTPPSSAGDSVPNSPLDKDLGTPERDTISQVSFSDNAGVVPSRYRNSTPEGMALFSSLLDGTGNTYTSISNRYNNSNGNSINSRTNNINSSGQVSGNLFGTNSNIPSLDSASPASTLAMFSESSPSPSLVDIVNTPLFETDKDGNVHFTPPVAPMSFTYEQTQALFTDFRDPSDPRDFFTGFDDPVDIATTSPFVVTGLLDHSLLDYPNTFVDMAPASTTSTPTTATAATTETAITTTDSSEEYPECPDKPKGPGLPPLDEDEKAIPCPQAWETIAKHPKFDDADIDDLCAQLKSKAKCSGHGPVIPISEVHKLMSRLDQE
ncbi:hypothetical protein EDD21DRAFT_370059 [Dissophora ornata]|nr:DNA-binding transcription factor yap1 [Dissophora ornata]KAI8603077.1 hypothetical protein EDD21DRAFT_370059 [Dissophora ornata]